MATMTNKTTLQEAIKKQTQLPWNGKKVKYFELKGPDQSTIDRKKNERKIKPPKNIELLEEDEPCSISDSFDEHALNEHEITSSIEVVNGGINYSNEFYERHWKKKQMQREDDTSCMNNNNNTNSSNKHSSSNSDNIMSDNDKTNDTEAKENCSSADEIIKRCGLSKNAAIRGLLYNNKITIQDLKLPPQCNNVTTTRSTSTIEQCNVESKGYLVEHPEVSDVFIHPFETLRKLNEHNYENVEPLPHVGRKTIITPRKYYLNEIDDDSFTFVRSDNKTKQ